MILAIDPGTNKLGWAVFSDGKLFKAGSVSASSPDRQLRTFNIILNLSAEISICSFGKDVIDVVCEEPLLRGKANNTMQRLLGYLEMWSRSDPVYLKPSKSIHYISPTTVKKFAGHGGFTKTDMAQSLLHKLTALEYTSIKDFVRDRDDDAIDAILIGLTYLDQKGLRDGNLNRNELQRTSKTKAKKARKKR